METIITPEKHGHRQWHPEIVNHANGSAGIHRYTGEAKKRQQIKNKAIHKIIIP